MSAAASEMTQARRYLILITLTSTVALYAMTVTIANVSLPQMQGSLAATQDQIAWIITFNIVATAVVTPLTGWLTARFGRRMVMIGGVSLFVVASFLCGTADSLETLVFYRILQGASGAPLVPLSQALTLETFPREQHGMATSVFGIGVVIGPIIAPTLGGYLSELYNWRWVFYMIVPFGLASLIGVLVFIRENRRDQTRFDWTGFLALSVAIGTFQLMLDRGERNNWLDSPEIIIEIGLALAAFWIFTVHSLTADRPFLNPRLLLDRNFSIGLLITLIFGMLNFTPMVLFPPLLQDLRGYPDSIIGLLLGARGGGTLIGFLYMLYGNRFDPRINLAFGFGSQGVAGAFMATFDINVSTFDVAWTSALQGLGTGFIWVPLTIITFRTLDPRHLPEATAIFHLLRNLGSSVFISISVAVVIRSSKTNYASLTEHVSPFNKTLLWPWTHGLWNFESSQSLAGMSGELQRQALMIGYINAFHLFTITAFAVLPLLLIVRMRDPAKRPA